MINRFFSRLALWSLFLALFFAACDDSKDMNPSNGGQDTTDVVDGNGDDGSGSDDATDDDGNNDDDDGNGGNGGGNDGGNGGNDGGNGGNGGGNGGNDGGNGGGNVSTDNYNLDVNKILAIVNKHRQAGVVCGSSNQKPVAPLKWNKQLAKAALDHANDMYGHNYFDHIGLNGSRFSDRAKAAGYKGFPVGENIALGAQSEEYVMNMWMESAGHCKNIMNGSATEIGIARSKKGNYWVMVLGSGK